MARHKYTSSPPPLGVDQSRLSQVYSNAPGKSAEETIDRLALQILQQGTSDRWTGQGGGDRYTNARWMASELYSKGGITRLEDFGRGYVDTPVETEAVRRYNPDTDGYSYYISEYDPANGYSYTEIDPSKVNGEFREKYIEYGEGGGYTQAFYVKTTRKDPVFLNKATGQLVSKDYGDSSVWGETYSGDGMTQYRVQFNELGMPIIYTQYQDNSDWGAISAIVSIASFIPGVAPFAQALNAAMQAYSGNTTGAILSALGSAYSFGQQYSNLSPQAIDYVKNAATGGGASSTLSNVADFFYKNAGNIKTVQQAGQIFSALSNKDLAGIIGGLQGLAPQIGVTIPESAVKSLQVAAVANAAARGDIAGTLLAAGTLSSNSDLTLAGKGMQIVNAAKSGNPSSLMSSVIDFGKTYQAMTPKDVQSALKNAGLPVSEKMASQLMSKDPASVTGMLESQFKAAKDAREIYKQESGSDLPDSFFESRYELSPEQLKSAADSLYTTQEEARNMWASKISDVAPTEFDLSRIQGLSEADASAFIKEESDNYQALRQALGRSLNSSDASAIRGKSQSEIDSYINDISNVDENEARQFFKSVYGSSYEPTKEEILSVMGVSDATSKNLVEQGYKQKINSALDGSKFGSKEEAARAAADNPSSQLFKWDGNLYDAANLRSVIQDAKVSDEIRKMSMFDATGYKTPEEARVAAEKAGFNSFYMKDGSEYSVTTPPIKDMLALADSMAADKGKSFNDVFAAYRKALGPGQTFEWQGKTYTTDFADPNVFDASKASDKNAAAALAYANGKDTFVAPDGKTYRIPEAAKQSLSNYLNQSPAETARLLGQNAVLEEVSVAKSKAPSLTADSMSFLEAAGTYLGATTRDLLIGMPNKGFGEALKFLSDTAVAAHMYKDPETGKVHFAIPRDNPLYKAGEYFSNIGDANTSAFVRQWRNEVISATEKETDPTSKLLTAAWMAAKNPVQGLLWGVEEGFNDLPALVVGGTGGILLRNSAAAGIPMAATLSNVAEVAGPAAMDTFDKGIKAGLEPAEAYDRAMKTMIGSAALSLVVSKHADQMLYKDLVSSTLKDSVGKVWGKNVAAQTLEEYVDEYSTASWKGWIDSGQPTDANSLLKIHNDATTQAAIASMVARNNVNASFMGQVIGNSITGKAVTLADLLSDNPPALDASTIRPNVVVGKTDGGNNVTLAQKMAETSFKDGPVSFFSSEAPEFVRNAAEPYLSLDNPNLSISDYFQSANILADNGYTNPSPQEVADLAGYAKSESLGAAKSRADDLALSKDEASDLLKSMGITNPTQEQINQFVGVGEQQKTDALKRYADPLALDQQEVVDLLESMGMTNPSQEQINRFVGVGEQQKADALKAYADPLALDQQEAADLFKSMGITNPTQEQINRFVGNGEPQKTDALKAYADPLALDQQEATDLLKSMGIANPSQEQINQFVGVGEQQKTDALKRYADPLALDQQEVVDLLKSEGIANPAQEQINQFVGVGEQQKTDALKSYADPLGTTEQEAKDFFESVGIPNPTQEQLNQFVNKTPEAETGSKIKTDYGTALSIDQVRYLLDKQFGGKAVSQEEFQSAIQKVASDLGVSKDAMLASIGATEQSLRSDFASQISGVQSQIGNVKATLESAIAEAKASGLAGDAALQSAINSVAASLGTTKADLLSSLGATEQSLRSEFSSQIGSVQTQIGDVQTALQQAIADARAAGLQGDAVLQTAIDTVAADLGTTKDDLLTQIGTTEENLRTEFADQIGEVQTQIGDVQTQIGDVQTALEKAIQGAIDAGLKSDEALQAAIDTVAADLGTTKDDLLTQLGTTEENLRTEFAEQIGEVQTQIGDVKQEVLDKLAEYEAAGLSRDEALDKAITDLSAQTGVSVGEIKTQLGDIETNLNAQLADAKKAILDQMAANEDAGMSRDQALSEAINSVAGGLNTTRESLLNQIGTTESNLRTEFSTQLGDVRSDIQAKYDSLTASQKAIADALVRQGVDLNTAISDATSSIQSDVQAKYDSLTAQQKATADALVKQGADLNAAIEQAVSGIQSDVQAKYDSLTASQKALADALVQQGVDLNTAINDATSSVQADVQAKYDSLSAQQKATADALVKQGVDLNTAIQQAATSIQSDVQAKYDSLTASQKALADALVQQGVDLNTAISDATSSIQSDVQAKYDSLTEQQKALADALVQQGADLNAAIEQATASIQSDVQAKYDSLTAQQKATADALVQQGIDLNTAIQQATSSIQSDVQAKYNSLTAQQKATADALVQQGIDLRAAIDVAASQTQQQIADLGSDLNARVDELMKQGQTYQQATQTAIGELNQQNRQLLDLVGTRARPATQQDIDAMTSMISGKSAVDLRYDMNNDGQITDQDIDWLRNLGMNTNVDWQPPKNSVWSSTGLYGQLDALEAKRRADAAEAQRAAQRAAEEAAARDAATQAQIQRQAALGRIGATNIAANQQAQQLAQQVQQYQKASQETINPFYAGEIQDFDLGAPLDFGFLKPSKEKQAGQPGGQATKIATGGYLDDLLDLLK